MFEKAVIFFTLLTAVSAQASVLDIQCQAADSKALNMTLAIDNVYGKYQFTGITLNGLERDNIYMTNQKLEALDTNGSFQINTSHAVSSQNILRLSLKVENCKDAILNKGVAASDEYIGGFDARRMTNFSCSCSLK